jgi:hypothetical protein
MKPTQLKKLLTAFCILLIISIGFWACKKQDEMTNAQLELKTLVKSVKTWYETNSLLRLSNNNNTITTLSANNSTEQDLIIENIPWDSAYIHYDSADRKGLAIPIYKNKVNGITIQLATISHNNKTSGYLIKTVPDSAWYSNSNNYGNFTGITYVYAANGKFLTRATFKDGANTSTKTVSTTGVGNSQIKTFDETLQEVTVTSVIKSKTYYFFYIVDIASQNQELVPVDLGAGGGVNSTSTTNPNNADSIINKLDSFPCAQNVLRQMPNINNEVKNILQNIFGVNSEINITFRPNSSLPADIAGLSSRASGSLANYQAIVDLNPKYLTGSQDYIAATLIHESLHAYLDYQRKVLDTTTFKNLFPFYWDFRGNEAQHNEMANNYINLMSNFLKNINANLPDNVANALAWGGLEKTAIWSTKDSTTIRNILNINYIAANPTQGAIDSLKLKKCN